MDNDEQSEVSFRAPKRRKVFRRTADTDNEEHRSLGAERAEDTISEQKLADEGTSSIDVLQARRRGGVGKGGIGFASADARRAAERELSEDRQLIVVDDSSPSEVPGNDRFVRPMGRAEAVEDKHMVAYIDSKLAEGRSTSKTSARSAEELSQIISSQGIDGTESSKVNGILGPITEHSTSARTIQQAQARSSRVYQRPTKRKPRPARPETDVARDSMIEQIMGENRVPHYQDAPTAKTVTQDEDEDHDAAAADAFKAQLLVDMQVNRRRPPLSKSNAATSTGPKLGGSRSQREKMKAMEEAKAGPGKK